MPAKSSKNMKIAKALAKFQGTMMGQLGEPLGLSIVTAFSIMVTSIVAAVNES